MLNVDARAVRFVVPDIASGLEHVRQHFVGAVRRNVADVQRTALLKRMRATCLVAAASPAITVLLWGSAGAALLPVRVGRCSRRWRRRRRRHGHRCRCRLGLLPLRLRSGGRLWFRRWPHGRLRLVPVCHGSPRTWLCWLGWLGRLWRRRGSRIRSGLFFWRLDWWCRSSGSLALGRLGSWRRRFGFRSFWRGRGRQSSSSRSGGNNSNGCWRLGLCWRCSSSSGGWRSRGWRGFDRCHRGICLSFGSGCRRLHFISSNSNSGRFASLLDETEDVVVYQVDSLTIDLRLL